MAAVACASAAHRQREGHRFDPMRNEVLHRTEQMRPKTPTPTLRRVDRAASKHLR
ncbi:MAG: hypothetical protein ABL974_01260 [Prosthecobacter sp.]